MLKQLFLVPLVFLGGCITYSEAPPVRTKYPYYNNRVYTDRGVYNRHPYNRPVYSGRPIYTNPTRVYPNTQPYYSRRRN